MQAQTTAEVGTGRQLQCVRCVVNYLCTGARSKNVLRGATKVYPCGAINHGRHGGGDANPGGLRTLTRPVRLCRWCSRVLLTIVLNCPPPCSFLERARQPGDRRFQHRQALEGYLQTGQRPITFRFRGRVWRGQINAWLPRAIKQLRCYKHGETTV